MSKRLSRRLAEARAELGDLATRAQYGGDITIITRRDKPIAAIVPLDLLPDEEDQEGGDNTA